MGIHRDRQDTQGLSLFVKDELYQNVKSKKVYACVRTRPTVVLRGMRAVGTRVVRNPDPKKYRLVERKPV